MKSNYKMNTQSFSPAVIVILKLIHYRTSVDRLIKILIGGSKHWEVVNLPWIAVGWLSALSRSFIGSRLQWNVGISSFWPFTFDWLCLFGSQSGSIVAHRLCLKEYYQQFVKVSTDGWCRIKEIIVLQTWNTSLFFCF